MRAFLWQNSRLIFNFGLLCVWFFGFWLWSLWVTATPLEEPLSLAPRGKLEKEIRVPLPENYDLNLLFERADIPYDAFRELVGDWTFKDGEIVITGVPVPVRWSLYSVDLQRLIAQGEAESFGFLRWTPYQVARQIDKVSINVEPGRYVFRGEVLQDVPELAHIKTRIALQLRPMVSATWQLAVVFLGPFVNYLILGPAALLLALILAMRAVYGEQWPSIPTPLRTRDWRMSWQWVGKRPS